jgi:hypothetical protein
MKPYKIRLLALLCCAVLLAGCSALPQGTVQVEELLRAPRLSGDYGEMQTALNEWLGESAQLKYPLNGELLSPFLLSDWDGDGEQDAAILYTTAQTTNVWLAILQRNADGQWKVRSAVEGLADTVESVSFARLQDSTADQIVVGYAATQGDEYLAVYAYLDGEVDTLLEQPYSQYLIEDITGTGHEDIVLLRAGDEETPVQIELLTADREGNFQQVTVLGLSPDRFTGWASLASGAGADRRHYLVLDGWTGVSGTNLASVLLRFDEETQQMVEAPLISADELYEASLRNVSSLTSRDLDGDGIVEIPTQPVLEGVQNLVQSRRIDLIVWMDYTSVRPKKSFGLLDEEYGYYLELPAEWQEDLQLRDGEDAGTIELWDLAGEQLYMRLRVASAQANATGWTRLGVLAQQQLQVKMADDVSQSVSAKGYRLAKALYIL